MNFLLRLLITAAVAYGLAKVLDGIEVTDFWTAFIFAVVLALLNVFVKPILIILTLPVTILTLGLFLFVINALVVLLASRLVDGFVVANFWWGLLFALLLSLINMFLGRELDKDKRTRI
jgi:putative membrane protein